MFHLFKKSESKPPENKQPVDIDALSLKLFDNGKNTYELALFKYVRDVLKKDSNQPIYMIDFTEIERIYQEERKKSLKYLDIKDEYSNNTK